MCACVSVHTTHVQPRALVKSSVPFCPRSQDERLCPALGITWANQLFMRLMADRVREEEAMLGPSGCPARTLRVVFAPHLPPCSCSYTVSEEGVRGTLETAAC